jgi:nicotinate dehydrogenase subunit A
MTDLDINGLVYRVDEDPDTPLINILRDSLFLTGTRTGCALEQCGCCVVLVDDQPTYACTTRLADCVNRRVETVEGLADEAGHLHPLQQAFLDANAAQCGFCTSGILMRAKALLASNAHPSRDEIAAALDDHLCRCGAHPRIIRAIETAARKLAVS